jgi:hypothetical protein
MKNDPFVIERKAVAEINLSFEEPKDHCTRNVIFVPRNIS